MQKQLEPDMQVKFHFFNTFFFKKLTEKSVPSKGKAGVTLTVTHIDLAFATGYCCVIIDMWLSIESCAECVCYSRWQGRYARS